MKSIDLIRWALRKTDEWATGAAEEMRDAPLVQPTPRGGNHPLWVMGHLAVVEGSVRQVLSDEPNPVEHWKPLFWQGTTPTTDAAAYPPYEEVLATYRNLRARNLAQLEAIGDDGLDEPPAVVPAGFEEGMRTKGARSWCSPCTRCPTSASSPTPAAPPARRRGSEATRRPEGPTARTVGHPRWPRRRPRAPAAVSQATNAASGRPS